MACIDSPVLPNGSAIDRRRPQLFENHQHGERTFQLPIHMHLVAAKPSQLVGVEGPRIALPRDLHSIAF